MAATAHTHHCFFCDQDWQCTETTHNPPLPTMTCLDCTERAANGEKLRRDS